MGRPLPSLLIGAARVPAPRGSVRAFGKADLARALAGAEARRADGQDILLIRRMRCRPTAPLDKTVAAGLADFRRRAVRPQRGVVPDGADAVVFASTAELLACLMRLGADQPWWRAVAARLLGPIETPARLGQMLAERATHLPAAIAFLVACIGRADAAARLAQFDVVMLARAVADVWAIGLEDAEADLEVWHARRSFVVGSVTLPSGVTDTRVQAAAFIAAVQQLGMTYGSPSSRRTAAQALHVAAGIVEVRDSTPPGVAETDVPPAHAARSYETRQALAPAADQAHADSKETSAKQHDITESMAQAAPQPSERQTAEWQAQTTQTAQRGRSDVPSKPTAPDPDPLPQPASAQDTGPDPDLAATEDGADTDERSDAASILHPRQIRTDLGGVFFLWHLCRAFDLPDAAQEWEMPDALGPWGLIEAIARTLLTPDVSAGDPIWTLLAELDGRDPDAPIGGGLPAPHEHVPTPSPHIAPALAAFLARIMPAMRARLADALDGSPDTVGHILRRAARIDLAPAEIDVVFAMADADAATRRAGLDVDPGWVPALGHIMRFHYV
ncbi:MAG: hypothetical protein AAFQ59_02210 [Pseudomonadota bacterium]